MSIPTRLETVTRIIRDNLDWHVIDSAGLPVVIPNKNLSRLLACYKSKLTIISGAPLSRKVTDEEFSLWHALNTLLEHFRHLREDGYITALFEDEEGILTEADLQLNRLREAVQSRGQTK